MFGRTGSLSVIAAALSTFVAGFALAADPISYEMVAYTDGVGSDKLFARRYEDAIATVSTYRGETLEDRLIASTNLCVAYTSVRDFAAADDACSSALKIARRVDVVPGSRLRHNTETAKALSNLGVLKALQGDIGGAASDFRKAARMTRWDGPQRNLAYLEFASEDGPRFAQTSN
jgi:hypothetical protein